MCVLLCSNHVVLFWLTMLPLETGRAKEAARNITIVLYSAKIFMVEWVCKTGVFHVVGDIREVEYAMFGRNPWYCCRGGS